MNIFTRAAYVVVAILTVTSLAASDAGAPRVTSTFCAPCRQPLVGEIPVVPLWCQHGTHISCMLSQLRDDIAAGRVSDKRGIVCYECARPVSMRYIYAVVSAIEKETGRQFFDEELRQHFLFYDRPPCDLGTLCFVGVVAACSILYKMS